MRCRAALFAVSVALATAGWSTQAEAAGPRRVLVAGPEDDAIALRVQKELSALGFETVRVGGLDTCGRRAVLLAAQDTSATAVTCSDGDQVGIWVAEGGMLRLRDVMVVREDDGSARETTAVRAAEVARATIAMRDADEEAARATPPVASPVSAPAFSGDWEALDRPEQVPAPRSRSVNRAPAFLASAGASALLGVDASAAAFSGRLEMGVLRHVTAAVRIDYPLESSKVGGGSMLLASPAFAGAGIGVPLSGPDSLVIPRAGGGIGLAWVRARRPEEQLFDGAGAFVSFPESVDTAASLAAFAEVGLSMRLYRPLRLTVDALVGSTANRLVVRDRGTHVAYWGTPFGAFAFRLELLFK